MSKLGDVLSKEVHCNFNVSQTGTEPPTAVGCMGLGAKSPAAGQFFVIFWKKKLFSHHWITFRTYSEPFEVLDF